MEILFILCRCLFNSVKPGFLQQQESIVSRLVCDLTLGREASREGLLLSLLNIVILDGKLRATFQRRALDILRPQFEPRVLLVLLCNGNVNVLTDSEQVFNGFIELT